MNKLSTDQKTDHTPTPGALAVETSRGRRNELLSLVLRNLEVGRQNLHDTQFSPDAKLIEFYEGVALSIQDQSEIQESYDAIEEHFQQAARLLSASKKNRNAAQFIIGLHAFCNLATIRQRRALNGWRLAEPIQLDGVRSKILDRARSSYQLVVEECQTTSDPRTRGVHYTARFGRLVCWYALWKAGVNFDPTRALNVIAKEIVDEVKSFGEILADETKRQEVNPPNLRDADESQASAQILEQIRTVLALVGKDLDLKTMVTNQSTRTCSKDLD